MKASTILFLGLLALPPSAALPVALSGAPTQVGTAEPTLLASLPSGELPDEASLAPLFFHDDRLEAMVGELERRSPTAAAMISAIRRAGYPLVFGTFKDLAEEMRQEYGTWDPARKRTVGYMAPIVRPMSGLGAPLTTVRMLVAVNLGRLEEMFEEARATVPDGPVSWDRIQRLETLAVLAHELVHAYGLALSGGDPHLGCPDPREDEDPKIACVVIGENLVRRELGAPLDWGYGLASVSTLAERYAQAEAHRARLLEIATRPVRLPAFERRP